MRAAALISVNALRALWVVNLALGVYIAYLSGGGTKPWTLAHVFTGILIVALVWFLGVAQALVRGGSLTLTLITFGIGLGVTLIGMAQVAAPGGPVLITVQVLHVAFVLAAIASGELCWRRYRAGLASQTA